MSITEISKEAKNRGMLEFAILLLVSQQKIYVENIPASIKINERLSIEGKLPELLFRLQEKDLLEYSTDETKKYYSLTTTGKENLRELSITWKPLMNSIKSLEK